MSTNFLDSPRISDLGLQIHVNDDLQTFYVSYFFYERNYNIIVGINMYFKALTLKYKSNVYTLCIFHLVAHIKKFERFSRAYYVLLAVLLFVSSERQSHSVASYDTQWDKMPVLYDQLREMESSNSLLCKQMSKSPISTLVLNAG
jgi:hypothetical protein